MVIVIGGRRAVEVTSDIVQKDIQDYHSLGSAD